MTFQDLVAKLEQAYQANQNLERVTVTLDDGLTQETIYFHAGNELEEPYSRQPSLQSETKPCEDIEYELEEFTQPHFCDPTLGRVLSDWVNRTQDGEEEGELSSIYLNREDKLYYRFSVQRFCIDNYEEASKALQDSLESIGYQVDNIERVLVHVPQLYVDFRGV